MTIFPTQLQGFSVPDVKPFLYNDIISTQSKVKQNFEFNTTTLQ